jgi:hypothetical protein
LNATAGKPGIPKARVCPQKSGFMAEFVGFERKRGATAEGCWEILLAMPAKAGCNRVLIVLAKGEHPDQVVRRGNASRATAQRGRGLS